MATAGTYRAVYGQGIGNGPLAGLLGDPSKFKATFNDGGAYWIIATDVNGNPWMVLIQGPKKQQLYDWGELGDTSAAAVKAAALFDQLEAENAKAQGLVVDRSLYLDVPLVTTGVKFGPGALNGGLPGSNVTDATNYLNAIPWQELPGTPSQFVVYKKKTTAFDPVVDDLDVAGQGTGQVVAGADPSTAARVTIALNMPQPNGGAPTPMWATANAWLRIAFLTNTRTTHHGGADFLTQILETIEDVIKIVVAVFSANVGMAVSAVADICETWYQYVEDKAKAAAAAQALGYALQGESKQAAPSASLPSLRIGAGIALDSHAIAAAAAAASAAVSPASTPQRLPTVGETRATNNHTLAEVLLGAAALFVVLGR